MITADGWLNWAKRDPGPADKVYSQANASIGYVPHSAVGYYGGWRSRLDSLERDPDDPRRYSKYAAASVTGWIAYDGTVTQHYPFSASCWASGNAYANTHFNAFENEGGYPNLSEPLTEAQIAANVRIIRELSASKGWTPERGVNLLEHHECVERWGGGATSCPNGRIPWDEIMRRLAPQEDEMLKKLMYVAGAFQFLASDVYHGFSPNPVVCAEVLYLIGEGPVTPVTTRQHAFGLLLYAASEALRGNPLNETAKQQVRVLCKTRPVLQ